jgi:hypothetical protein
MNGIPRRTFLGRTALAAGACTLGQDDPAGAALSGRFHPPHQDTQDHHDLHLHLFLDDNEVAHQENLLLVLNKMHKHPAPVLVSDRPWEGERVQAWGNVIQEPNGLLRMWYFAFNTERRPDELDRGGYCYAESWDGIHWEKPPLDLFSFRGSQRNNQFYL